MTRFVSGKSGNPKGRPRKRPTEEPSAFDIIFDRTIAVHHDGEASERTIEEGLQLKTYQAALAGNRPARREILKMIAKREQWLAKRHVPKTKFEHRFEQDAANANPAMLILGITSRDERWSDLPDERYLLEPWAAQAAISRMRPKRMRKRELDECRRCTRDPESIDWPEATE